MANETELGESGGCLMWSSRVSSGIFARRGERIKLTFWSLEVVSYW